jgi:hypothetical protein
MIYHFCCSGPPLFQGQLPTNTKKKPDTWRDVERDTEQATGQGME